MAQSEGSFIRWQAIAIEQLGYAVGLILGFAGASLGFGLSLLRDPCYAPGCWGKAFMLACLSSFVVSLGLGIWCVVNRLCDFRKTRCIARDRENGEEISAVRRDETKKLGERSWLLFRWQIGSFSAGLIFLIVAFGSVYHSRLF
jgi:hypothetical protein